MTATWAAGSRINFTAQRKTEFHGHIFEPGDMIEVRLRNDWDEEEDAGQGGAWGWAGFTATTLRRIAAEIIDLQNGRKVYPQYQI